VFNFVNLSVFEEMKELLEEDFNEILIEYQNEIPKYISDIEIFFAENKSTDLMAKAHTLKSTSGNLGFEKIVMLSQQLEENLRKNNEQYDYSSVVKECINELNEVNAFICDYLKNNPLIINQQDTKK